MLFVHEVHQVVGPRSRDFEAAIRDDFQQLLAKTGDARLLWFLHQAHGTGPAYIVVTITAFRDAAAWQDLALRIQRGDLNRWARELDETRHDVRAKLLWPVPWAP